MRYSKVSYPAKIWALLGNEKKRLLKVLLASLILSILDVLGVGFVGPLVSMAIDQGHRIAILDILFFSEIVGLTGLTYLQVLSILVVFVFLIKFGVAILVSRYIFAYSARIDHRIRSSLIRRYYNMSIEEFAQRNSAHLIDTVQGLTGQFSYGLVASSLRLFTELLISISIMSYLCWLNPAIFFTLVFALGVIAFLFDFLFRSRIHGYGQEILVTSAGLVRALQQGLAGIKEIRIYGATERLVADAAKLAFRFSEANRKNMQLGVVPRYLIEISMVVFMVVVVLLSQLHSGEVVGGTVLMFGAYGAAMMRIAPATSLVMNGLSQFRFIRPAVNQIYDDLHIGNDLTYQPHQDENFTKLNTLEFSSLELVNVSYWYPGAENASLAGINLSIRRGEAIGIIGSSGSGKSTLAELIIGLREPTQGEIQLNGIKRCSTSIGKSFFAYLPQNVFIADASIAYNVSLAENFSEYKIRIVKALKLANLWEYVSALPDGIYSECGELGARLSGGQRQRLAVARALFFNRQFLVLDEATSAVDEATEHEIAKEIAELKGNCTLIIIAHRLVTVKQCDRLFVVENGGVREAPLGFLETR